MTAYYNEIDPYAAAWLRNLISAGHIAPGDVDERSIEDVRPDELRGYTQCHFFAGIGVWSHALRRAGWADDRPVWTGSCPCQPFSAAGKGGGFADERHLWPAFHHLITELRPSVVFGEQVASKDGLAWLDLVQADLEGTRYASGAVDLCAAGVGSPHIRQRLWWCAKRMERDTRDGRLKRRAEPSGRGAPGGCGLDWLDDDDDERLEGQRSGHNAALGHGPGSVRPTSETGQSDGMADADAGRWAERRARTEPGLSLAAGAHGRVGNPERFGAGRDAGTGPSSEGGPALWGIGHNSGSPGPACRPGPTNGLWRDADWLFCRDGKWRPVEPGTFPLAHGAASRVGRLRAYGNAIVAQAAQTFIESYLDAARERFRLTDLSVSSVKSVGVFG